MIKWYLNVKYFLFFLSYFRCEETEAEQKADMDRLGDELEDDITKLKQKLISETKRSGWETLRRSFIQAMQNDF